MTRTVWLTRALAILVLIAGLTYWRVFALLAGAPLSLGGLVVLAYSVLAVGSLAGLWLRRAWGFYALYGLIVYGTIMLGVLFIPVPLGFIPLRERWIAVTALNAAVLVIAGLTHHWSRTDAQGASGGAA